MAFLIKQGGFNASKLDTQIKIVNLERYNVKECSVNRDHTLFYNNNLLKPADCDEILCATTNKICLNTESSGPFFMAVAVRYFIRY